MGELSDVERTAGLAGIYLVGGPLRGGEKFVRADALLLPLHPRMSARNERTLRGGNCL